MTSSCTRLPVKQLLEALIAVTQCCSGVAWMG